MSESPRKLPPGPLSWLIDGATRGRIAIFLWRHYPKAFTVDEINRSLPFISKSRIQQVIQKMYEKGVVDREVRETRKPGPNPFEYRLTPFLKRCFEEGFVEERK